MCGRFAQIEPIGKIIKTFFIDEVLTDLVPSYNIAPGGRILSVVVRDGKHYLVDHQWGLIPYWAKDPSIGNKLINARGETVNQKPSFRNAFKSRRCLIPASGFYEWKKEGKIKIPYYVKLKSGSAFGFAGLHETWISPSGEEVRTCTIITTGANALMEPIHDRMPVIIPRDRHDQWLDTTGTPDNVLGLIAPYPAEEMELYQVSPMVNSPKNNSAECITRLQ
ncbi:MAG TPA: SOS response-associated peptidase [Spirochaetota bacterium]|nr:SOS response-associated peptidase [Spirochaetota bacterium]HRS77275.1 SOS response-associated peptidase [Spirochaetota bacterium]HRT75517.1 SOS response-associated peptidase [Spirochaetota bacterium]